MANAIDITYFTRDVFLPNSDLLKPEGQMYSSYISLYEPIFLDTFFGVTLATAVQGEINIPANVDLAKIVNGTTYVDAQGITRKWVGLKNAQKSSPIANYVYYQILRKTDSSTTGIGEMMQVTENAVRTDAGAKSTRAWNQMVYWLMRLDEFLTLNKSTYPTYVYNEELLTTTTRFSL